MILDVLAKVFREIAGDSQAAQEAKDSTRFHALVNLVVALEHAYPREMEMLREEEVI